MTKNQAIVAALAAGLASTASADVIASTLGQVGSDLNLQSFTNTEDGLYTSAADLFGIVEVGFDSMPFALADDSVTAIGGSVFEGDSQGILDGRFIGMEVFGAVDTVNGDNADGVGTAVWTFNFDSPATLDSVSIDLAAMGDFEDGSDGYEVLYSINGLADVSWITTTVDETLDDQPYTMEGGATPLIDDPILANGVQLNDEFQTFTLDLGGVSANLFSVTITGGGDGGAEAFAAMAIVVEGSTDGTGPVCPPDQNTDGNLDIDDFSA
ncbi:MAG: hypothetical protein AAF747_07720, partial [Planctomycetota bacterium]